MPPLAIGEHLDILEEGAASFEAHPKGLPGEEFTLQNGEEALSQRIVVAVANRPHRAADACHPTEVVGEQRGVLYVATSQTSPESVVYTASPLTLTPVNDSSIFIHSQEAKREFPLLHRHRFCQIAWLVNIAAACQRYAVCHHLERNDRQ